MLAGEDVGGGRGAGWLGDCFGDSSSQRVVVVGGEFEVFVAWLGFGSVGGEGAEHVVGVVGQEATSVVLGEVAFGVVLECGRGVGSGICDGGQFVGRAVGSGLGGAVVGE